MRRTYQRSVAILALLLGAAVCAEPTNELRAALQRKPNLEHGRVLHESCVGCHQPDGAGVAQRGIPNVSGQHYQVILKQLTDFLQTERLDLRMEAVLERHEIKRPQDLADVAAFIANLPVRGTQAVGSGKFADLGAKAYKRACLHCHGSNAEGNARLRYPRLAGQHYDYLVKQIDQMIGGSRFNVAWDHAQLMTSLMDDDIVGVPITCRA